jgi:hypothetical protein
MTYFYVHCYGFNSADRNRYQRIGYLSGFLPLGSSGPQGTSPSTTTAEAAIASLRQWAAGALADPKMRGLDPSKWLFYMYWFDQASNSWKAYGNPAMPLPSFAK